MNDSASLRKMLHDTFGEYLLLAAQQKLDPMDTIVELIEFCATECANGHAQITYKLKLNDDEIQKALRIFGNAFVNTFHNRLLQIGEIVN